MTRFIASVRVRPSEPPPPSPFLPLSFPAAALLILANGPGDLDGGETSGQPERPRPRRASQSVPLVPGNTASGQKPLSSLAAPPEAPSLTLTLTEISGGKRERERASERGREGERQKAKGTPRRFYVLLLLLLRLSSRASCSVRRSRSLVRPTGRSVIFFSLLYASEGTRDRRSPSTERPRPRAAERPRPILHASLMAKRQSRDHTRPDRPGRREGGREREAARKTLEVVESSEEK